ncbi:MAG: hypothetical protein JSV01_08020, partial [Desulfobacterales bacterium]
ASLCVKPSGATLAPNSTRFAGLKQFRICPPRRARSLRPDGCPKKLIMVAQSGYAEVSDNYTLTPENVLREEFP